ncbi:protein SHORT-ROOT-like [Prosopis cineraria]|uniref:protein SHORT-ROOT-like n=1 Tax=Prosopis cineraria TaxID=364024 RepID=UPI00240F22D9|nr:protein SHORT-ROOT-like [Prosopis cineraria]
MMDTLFRVLNFQHQPQPDHSLNSTTSLTTSGSSKSSMHNCFPPPQHQEECFNLFMDEEDLSSSSSKHCYPCHLHPSPATAADFSFSPTSDFNSEFSGNARWVSDILIETARAFADKNSPRIQQLMWMLNELASPYGDAHQKLASYFLQALFARMTDSGLRTYRIWTSASDKNCSFESTRKTVLKFQ